MRPVGQFSFNFVRNADPVLTEALDRSRAAGDEATRTEAYRVVQERLAADLPYVYSVRYRSAIGTSNQVHGLAEWTFPDGQPGRPTTTQPHHRRSLALPVSPPSSHPPHWEFDTVLGDGGTAHIRPILATDADALVRFHDGLSRETRYYRFFSPKSELTPAEVERFTTVDQTDRVALVAFDGDELIAVARYDRLPDPDLEGRLGADAEVAFTVADAHQGRGLGTLMLEYLAAAGRENGIERFVAETMPDNRPMIAVFHAAGYRTVDRFADGMVQVEFPIAATDAAREAVRRHEHRAEARSIARVLTPSSIVVIGPSEVPDSAAARVRRNLARYVGEVRAVERADELAALDLSGDLAVVATAAEDALGAVRACAGHGVDAVVVLADGGGPARVAELLSAARHEGLRLVGPGSIGLVNTALGLHATVAPVLPRPGRLGVMAEAGPVAVDLLTRLEARGLGVSTFVSAGDKADVSGNDLLQYWEDDPGTDVVLLHLESFGNPRKFARIARRVSVGTPIVAVWSGASATDLDDRAVEALFRQAGVMRVESTEAMVDAAASLLGRGGDGSPAGPVLDRQVERWGSDRASEPLVADLDIRAARALVTSALADAETLVAPDAVGVALLAACGITVVTAPAPVPDDSTRATVAVVQDPTFGPLVTVGSVPGPGFAPTGLWLVPLTDRDVVEAATTIAPEPSPALEDLLARLGRLADDLEEVDELVLDPVVVHAEGVTVGAVDLRLRRVVPHLPELVRRLRT